MKYKTRKNLKKGGGEFEKHKKYMSNIFKSPEFNIKKQTLKNYKLRIANILKTPEFVNKYFDNFKNFKLAKSATRIGAPSQNGAVLRVPFEKNGYKTYALLKFSVSEETDNLMYEAYAGFNFINKYVNIYPIFTETYGCFLLPNKDKYLNVMRDIYNNIPVKIDNLNLKSLSLDKFSFETACANPTYITPLIQYFDNFNTFTNEYNNDFLNTYLEMPGLLYQLYFALERLKDCFTHYDLHGNNAGYYKPFTNKYIVMNYHLENDDIISFPTIYIAKIIDYGRCHFCNCVVPGTNDIINQLSFYNCNKKGFYWIRGTQGKPANDPKSSNHWVNPLVKNNSHDLRLLNILKTKLTNYSVLLSEMETIKLEHSEPVRENLESVNESDSDSGSSERAAAAKERQARAAAHARAAVLSDIDSGSSERVAAVAKERQEAIRNNLYRDNLESVNLLDSAVAKERQEDEIHNNNEYASKMYFPYNPDIYDASSENDSLKHAKSYPSFKKPQNIKNNSYSVKSESNLIKKSSNEPHVQFNNNPQYIDNNPQYTDNSDLMNIDYSQNGGSLKYLFFNDIIYLDNYGTPENLLPYDKIFKIIKNISGARKSLEDFLPNWCESQKIEEKYIKSGLKKEADIHVYYDGRPYEYIIS